MRVFINCKEIPSCDVRELARKYNLPLIYAKSVCDSIDIVSRGIGKMTVWEIGIDEYGKDDTGETKLVFEPAPQENATCRGVVHNSTGQIGYYETVKLMLSNFKDDSVVITLNE